MTDPAPRRLKDDFFGAGAAPPAFASEHERIQAFASDRARLAALEARISSTAVVAGFTAKAVVLAALAGAALGGGVAAGALHSTSREPAAAIAVADPATPLVVATPSPEKPRPALDPPAHAVLPKPTPEITRKPIPAAAASTLAEEMAAYDRALTLLRAGRPETALVEIDRLLAEHATSVLAPNATAARVEALVALGRHADAEGAATAALDGGELRSGQLAPARGRLLGARAAARLALGRCDEGRADWAAGGRPVDAIPPCASDRGSP